MHIVRAAAGVRVPATSGNLRLGFGCLGLAHSVWDEVRIRLTTGSTRVHILGEDRGALPTGDSHLVVRAMRRGFDATKLPQAGTGLNCRNGITQGRGLGSSAATVVAGLMLVRGLADESELSDDNAVLRLATEFEGHPDNAAPALHGGAVLSWMTDEKPKAAKIDVARKIRTILLVPEAELVTEAARSALPSDVPHGDVAFNASRAAMLALTLQGRPDLLLEAASGHLHQCYRADSMPESTEALRTLRKAEQPVVVSRAGPSVLAFDKLDRRTRDLLAARGFRSITAGIGSDAHLIEESR